MVASDELQVQSSAAQASLAKVTELSAILLADCTPSASTTTATSSSPNAGAPEAAPGASYSDLRKSLRDAIDALEASATKVAVGIGAMTLPEQADTLLKSFVDPFSHFSTFAFLVVHMPVCDLLERDTSSLLRNVCAVSKEFLSAIAEHRRADVLVAVGKFGEIKSTAVKLPMSNRAAVKRYCLESLAPIKDTIDEFSELLDDARESGFEAMPRDGQADDDVDMGDSFAALDGLDDEELSEAEGRTLEVSLALLNDTRQLVRAAAVAVGAMDPPTEVSTEHVSWLNGISVAVGALVRGVSDFGAELYPSHDGPELSAAAEKLFEQAKALGKALLGNESMTTLMADQKAKDAVEGAESSMAEHTAQVLELIVAAAEVASEAS